MTNKLNEVRKALLEHAETITYSDGIGGESRRISAFLVSHNKEFVALLFCGWWIRLESDGTWNLEDTTGG